MANCYYKVKVVRSRSDRDREVKLSYILFLHWVDHPAKGTYLEAGVSVTNISNLIKLYYSAAYLAS